ncbi:glucan biosynthesis protein [Limimaricola pyoseonensis]|uniref:Glucans biosynthesis protein n=1 Tax=Limimaricola pyoseonensis TaxID=521013 RepID=A0A1G7H3W1_9RHOB|nr:glucan biosynthesis protein G [Limimaricola pyoseonensis]SDE95096.1 glucans biosynthesis protein [Limimaricola pyoseonensis]
MTKTRPAPSTIDRRALLQALALTAPVLAGIGRVGPAMADEAPRVIPPSGAAPEPETFSFDALTETMRAAATRPAPEPETVGSGLGELGYDDYRMIAFRPDRARWRDDADTDYRVHAFHMGWLFQEPVRLYEVEDGLARPLAFTTEDFRYHGPLEKKAETVDELPGVAGFRLNAPLNRPDREDELVAFLGASYFRALGKNSRYGLSARGVAIDTATSEAEEFPRFSRFWLEKAGKSVVIYAALEGPSLTGAYRFVVTPGAETVMDVTARLFFRRAPEQLGVAPLTSMFLYSEKNRADFDDYRPAVHDSDGLMIRRRDGDVIWRPLNNPPRLSGSYFSEESPRGFGLHQRDRDFEAYQDGGARYERRPSLMVEPQGDWGRGAVRLVEIPTDLEANDNIVAFWVPEKKVEAGEAREYAYRLRWGDLPVDPAAEIAHVAETRAGAGGVSGVEAEANSRKFVIDLEGGLLADLPADAEVTLKANAKGGKIISQTLERIEANGVWRVVLDVTAPEGETVELAAHVAGFDRKLSETWLYQWINA